MITEQEETVIDQVKHGAMDILSKTKDMAVKIVDDSTFLKFTEYRKTINKWKKDAIEQIEPLRKKAHETYLEVLKQKDMAVKPLDEALSVIDPLIAEYNREQVEKAKLEQIRLQEYAKKQQEEAILKKAQLMEINGNSAGAEAVLSTPVIAPKVEVPTAQATQGVAFKQLWSVSKEVDLMKLAKAVVDGQVPVEALQPNFVFLNKMAKAMKTKMNYAGVEVVCTESVSSTRK